MFATIVEKFMFKIVFIGLLHLGGVKMILLQFYIA